MKQLIHCKYIPNTLFVQINLFFLIYYLPFLIKSYIDMCKYSFVLLDNNFKKNFLKQTLRWGYPTLWDFFITFIRFLWTYYFLITPRHSLPDRE